MEPTRRLRLNGVMNIFPYAKNRAEALTFMETFMAQRLPRYTQDRNYVKNETDQLSTSLLSPYLQRRLILEEEVIAASMHHCEWPVVEKFVQEVMWRMYWKAYLAHHPYVWTAYRDSLSPLEEKWGRDPAYQNAISGQTGIDAFDHWATQLIHHHYLHNHVRMWFASIWIYTLKLPWQLGANFFYRHLIDGDAASNTLSWRWVAGLHTAGKQYLARADNIEKYTRGEFGPDGLATQTFAIEDDAITHPPASFTLYPDTSAPRDLVLHPEHLYIPPSLFPTGVARIFTLSRQPCPLNLAPDIFAYEAELLETVAQDYAQQFGIAVIRLESARDLLDAGVHTAYAVKPAVGPLQDLFLALNQAGMHFQWLPRPWEEPLMAPQPRGFFSFWKRAQKRLAPLEI